MDLDTYIPEWRIVQRVLELVNAAGGRELPEPHLPERVDYSVYDKPFPKRNRGVVTKTSGCKMHARFVLPDSSGPDSTALCAVCDAPNLMPRIARDL